MKRTITGTALLLLAGCSSGGEPRGNAQEAALANRIELAPNGEPEPRSDRSPVARKPAFPAAFVGRWGITEADCDPSNNANKGLLEVGTDTLRFYESSARLTGIAGTSRYAFTADLAFAGEGQKWTARQSFALATGGTALLRTEQSPVKTYRYGRC